VSEALALLLTAVVHIAGLVALIWALIMDAEDRPDWREWWPGGGEKLPGDPPPAPPAGQLPLPGAAPSAVRLREPARIADGYPAPDRRPAHPPQRTPRRTPAPR
jgi:hypothetical protein